MNGNIEKVKKLLGDIERLRGGDRLMVSISAEVLVALIEIASEGQELRDKLSEVRDHLLNPDAAEISNAWAVEWINEVLG